MYVYLSVCTTVTQVSAEARSEHRFLRVGFQVFLTWRMRVLGTKLGFPERAILQPLGAHFEHAIVYGSLFIMKGTEEP